jgi:hypothetical protein
MARPTRPIMASAVCGAESVSAREYVGRVGRLKSLAHRAASHFGGFDVIATPTLCLTPPVLADARATTEEQGIKNWSASCALRRAVHGWLLRLRAV